MLLAVIRKKLVLHLLSREGLKVSCSQLNNTLDALVKQYRLVCFSTLTLVSCPATTRIVMTLHTTVLSGDQLLRLHWFRFFSWGWGGGGEEVMLLDVLAVIRKKKLVLRLLSREGLKVSCSQLNYIT
jgi:hypothetical protein